MTELTPQKLVILGSTGSIGRQTLDVVRTHPRQLQVVGLSAGHNFKLLAEQIAEFRPRFIFCQEDQAHLPFGDYKFMTMEEMVSQNDVDIVVAALSGASGLMPLISAIKAGKIIALANKEALVMAGAIIMPLTKKHNAQIRPVDSEHSAIWQCISGEKSAPSRIILTASGGPFREYSMEDLQEVSVEQTLRHPSWAMGQKVTVDSATLMNKGLEVIEAHWLFGMPFEHIDVLIHPQSIVHSMVEFTDGSIKAQLGMPYMHLPIQYAISHPYRWDNHSTPRLDFSKINFFTFEQPDMVRFPCLKMAIEAGKEGGTCPTVMCAADEIAIKLFLSGDIKFHQIPRLVEKVLAQHRKIAQPSIEEILNADAEACLSAQEVAQEEKLHC